MFCMRQAHAKIYIRSNDAHAIIKRYAGQDVE